MDFYVLFYNGGNCLVIWIVVIVHLISVIQINFVGILIGGSVVIFVDVM